MTTRAFERCNLTKIQQTDVKLSKGINHQHCVLVIAIYSVEGFPSLPTIFQHIFLPHEMWTYISPPPLATWHPDEPVQNFWDDLEYSSDEGDESYAPEREEDRGVDKGDDWVVATVATCKWHQFLEFSTGFGDQDDEDIDSGVRSPMGWMSWAWMSVKLVLYAFCWLCRCGDLWKVQPGSFRKKQR